VRRRLIAYSAVQAHLYLRHARSIATVPLMMPGRPEVLCITVTAGPVVMYLPLESSAEPMNQINPAHMPTVSA
jgi:hypothetical protein